MKLVFDAERLRNPNSGLGQFCGSLGRALLAQAPDDAGLTFIVPPAAVGALGEAQYLEARWWQRLIAPSYADVWHATHQDVWIKPPYAAKVVLSIMDLNFLERPDYSPEKKARRLAAVQRQVDRASVISTISEFTAGVVRRHLDVSDLPVVPIHLGNPIRDVTSTPRLPASPMLSGLLPGKFFVFVGVLHPKKNVHTLLPVMRAFPDMQLVLAGPADSPYARQLVTQARAAGVEKAIVIPGAVDEETKRWLYANARALLFPSLSEGFGLPVVEAMGFGKPAFLSRLTSLPEIGGDAAFYFDSFDPESMVATIRRGLAEFDADPHAAATRKAYAARFSWERAATAYWTLYREALLSQRR